MMNILPDKITRIDIVRIERNKQKLCTCLKPRYEIDVENKLVSCIDCGAILDAFDALYNVAKDCDRLNNQVDSLLSQAKIIKDYKPHLKVIKELESNVRRRLYPRCPHCNEGIDLKDINSYTSYPSLAKRSHGNENNT